MQHVLIAYVPVPHAGFLKFFQKHQSVDCFYILGPDLTAEFKHLYKDIHALPQEKIKQAIDVWGIFPKVHILNRAELEYIQRIKPKITMPQEDITQELAEKYFTDHEVVFDGTVFLRWDKHNTVVEKPPTPDVVMSKKEFDRDMIQLAYDQRVKSSDWWRQVGCIIVKDGEPVVMGYNQHVPSPHTPYAEGNPRNNFSKGINLELINVIHGEAFAIAEAARNGIALEGASIYASTFPCPPCAKLIAYSGIKKCYFHDGYGVSDGERIMKDKGVKLIYVDMGREVKDDLAYEPYEK